jgi:hypothetical protein
MLPELVHLHVVDRDNDGRLIRERAGRVVVG